MNTYKTFITVSIALFTGVAQAGVDSLQHYGAFIMLPYRTTSDNQKEYSICIEDAAKTKTTCFAQDITKEHIATALKARIPIRLRSGRAAGHGDTNDTYIILYKNHTVTTNTGIFSGDLVLYREARLVRTLYSLRLII